MKPKRFMLALMAGAVLFGCSASPSENGGQDVQPTASAEPPVEARAVLSDMQGALDEQKSFNIKKSFALEFSGDMNPGYASSYSDLAYIREGDSFKVLGSEGTGRDAGSNDKTSEYHLYAEPNEEGGMTLLQTLANSKWAKEKLESTDSLDNTKLLYDLSNNLDRCVNTGEQELEGKQVYVLEYTLAPSEVLACAERLAANSVPASMLGEEAMQKLSDTVEMKQLFYIDVESKLPVKWQTDYMPLFTEMLKQAGLNVEATKAEETIEIGSFDEVADFGVPESAQPVYEKKK